MYWKLAVLLLLLEIHYGTAVDGSLACEFEVDLCQWNSTSDDNDQWVLKNKTIRITKHSTTEVGPGFGHSAKTKAYLYISSWPQKNQKTPKIAELLSPVMAPIQEGCFSFYYHMFGSFRGNLSVYLISLNGGQRLHPDLIWQNPDSQDNKWRQVQRDISTLTHFQISIEGIAEAGKGGDIALDTFNFTEGKCHSDLNCDFENDACGWTSENSQSGKWERGTALAMNGLIKRDHTTKTSIGYFEYVNINFPTTSGQQRLKYVYNTDTTTPSPICMRFWYLLTGGGIINLLTKDAKADKAQHILKKTDPNLMEWRQAGATIDIANGTEIILESQLEGLVAVIAVDDISFEDSLCEMPGNCTFQNGLCGWLNMPNEDTIQWMRRWLNLPNLPKENFIQWMRSMGGSLSVYNKPLKDHTTGGDSGFYLFIDSWANPNGSVAVLLSELYSMPLPACFELSYQISTNGTGALQVSVNINSGFITKRITDVTGERYWRTINIPIESKNSTQFIITITATVESEAGYIAIDDLNLLQGYCPGMTTVSTSTEVASTTPMSTAEPPVTSSGCTEDFCKDYGKCLIFVDNTPICRCNNRAHYTKVPELCNVKEKDEKSDIPILSIFLPVITFFFVTTVILTIALIKRRRYTWPIRYHSSGIFDRSNPLYGRNSMSESTDNSQDTISSGLYFGNAVFLDKDFASSHAGSSSA